MMNLSLRIIFPSHSPSPDRYHFTINHTFTFPHSLWPFNLYPLIFDEIDPPLYFFSFSELVLNRKFVPWPVHYFPCSTIYMTNSACIGYNGFVHQSWSPYHVQLCNKEEHRSLWFWLFSKIITYRNLVQHNIWPH